MYLPLIIAESLKDSQHFVLCIHWLRVAESFWKRRALLSSSSGQFCWVAFVCVSEKRVSLRPQVCALGQWQLETGVGAGSTSSSPWKPSPFWTSPTHQHCEAAIHADTLPIDLPQSLVGSIHHSSSERRGKVKQAKKKKQKKEQVLEISFSLIPSSCPF